MLYGIGFSCFLPQTVGTHRSKSGDYNQYPEVKELSATGKAVTLKGEAGEYVAASWSDGEFSYSLKLSDGLPEDGWSNIISQIS